MSESAMPSVVQGFYVNQLTSEFQEQLPDGTVAFMLNRVDEVKNNRYTILPIQIINWGLYRKYGLGLESGDNSYSVEEVLSGFAISDTPVVMHHHLMHLPQTALDTAGISRNVLNIWGDNIRSNDVVGFMLAFVKNLAMSDPRQITLRRPPNPDPEKAAMISKMIPQLIPISDRLLREQKEKQNKDADKRFRTLKGGAEIVSIVKFYPFGRVTYSMQKILGKRSPADFHDTATHFEVQRNYSTSMPSKLTVFLTPCVH